MFKKLADLLFEEVEEEVVEEEVKTEKAKKESPAKHKIVETEKVKSEVEPIQKTFDFKKEKSIFIDNSSHLVKAESKIVKKATKPTDEIDYEFTPIISPIRGLRDSDKKTYQVNRSEKKTVPITVSRLGTIISPIYGLGKGKNKETFEKLAKMQKEADAKGVLEVDQKFIDETLKLGLEAKDADKVGKTHKINQNKEDQKESLFTEEIFEAEKPEKEFTYLTLDDLIVSENDLSSDVSLEKNLIHFFIGIKGTGMSALALLLNSAGYQVLGSDTKDFVFTEEKLKNKNIEMLAFDKNNIKDNMVVIIGNSFYDDHPEVRASKNNETVKTYSYHQFLGKFIKDYNSIAVAGSHGKTTTTSMIVDMLKLHQPMAYLIGDGRGALDLQAESIAIEACEYKRHFLSYKADYGVITNLEWDHVDYFKTEADYLLAFEQFANQIKDTVLIYGDDENIDKLNINTKVLFYGESDKNNIQAINIEESRSGTSFEVVYLNENIGKFEIDLIGRHMMHNALAAIGIGKLKGLSNDEIKAGLNNYQGAPRRFEIVEIGESVVIDDYAHHPTEVNLTIKAAKTKYPNQKLVAIYHPDRISRLNTFIDDYIKALKQADHVGIGRAVDSDGMTKVIDLSELVAGVPKAFVVDDNQASISKLARFSPAVYLFMGTKEMHSIKTQLINYLKRIDI